MTRCVPPGHAHSPRRRRRVAAVGAAFALVLAVGACSDGSRTAAKGATTTTIGPGARCSATRAKPLTPPTDSLKRWIPATLDGETLTATEFTDQLANASGCIRSIVGAQLPAVAAAAPGAPGTPRGLLIAMTSTQDTEALFGAIVPGAKSGLAAASTKTIEGRNVEIRSLDLAALTGGSTPTAPGAASDPAAGAAPGADPGSPPTTSPLQAALPTVTLAAFRPDGDTVVFATSFAGPELAEKLLAAAIRNHGGK